MELQKLTLVSLYTVTWNVYIVIFWRCHVPLLGTIKQILCPDQTGASTLRFKACWKCFSLRYSCHQLNFWCTNNFTQFNRFVCDHCRLGVIIKAKSFQGDALSFAMSESQIFRLVGSPGRPNEARIRTTSSLDYESDARRHSLVITVTERGTGLSSTVQVRVHGCSSCTVSAMSYLTVLLVHCHIPV